MREVKAEGFGDEISECLGQEFILRNGVRIFLKWNDFFDDEVLLKGLRWGGLSEYQEKDHVLTEALYSSTIADELGLYGLRPESLNESLEGRRRTPSQLKWDVFAPHG